jgi:hypothetical protein
MPLTARETVAMETPALLATSRMDAWPARCLCGEDLLRPFTIGRILLFSGVSQQWLLAEPKINPFFMKVLEIGGSPYVVASSTLSARFQKAFP